MLDDHPDDDLLMRYASGRSAPGEALAVEEHLAGCDACVARVRALDHLRTDLEGVLEGWNLAEHQRLAACVAKAGPPPARARPPAGVAPWLIWTGVALGGLAAAITLLLTLSSGQSAAPVRSLHDAQGTASLFADGRVTISTVPTLDPDWGRRVARAWSSGELSSLPVISAAGLGRDLATLGVDENDRSRPAAISPRATTVRSGPVALRWRSPAGATEQRIVLGSGEGSEQALQTTDGATVMIELAPAMLRPGLRHTWQVEARVAGVLRLSPPASFLVLSAADDAMLAKLERELAGSDFALAVLYATYGLRDDARACLERLSSANPRDRAIERLLSSVRGGRPAE